MRRSSFGRGCGCRGRRRRASSWAAGSRDGGRLRVAVSHSDEWAGDLLIVDRPIGARFGCRLAAGKSQSQDRSLDAAKLLAEPATVIGQPVALADVFDLGGDLRISARRHVWEDVMLDLVAEVAGQDVEDG